MPKSARKPAGRRPGGADAASDASEDNPGVVTGQSRVNTILAAARPDDSLVALGEDTRSITRETQQLLQTSRRSLMQGDLTMTIPSALAGGRLGWTGRAGVVRELLARRLDVLLRDKRISGDQRDLLITRFALNGSPGGAQEA